MKRTGETAATPERNRTRAWTLCVAALALLVCAPACGSDREKSLAEARKNAKEFQQQMELLTQAQSTGDSASAAAAEQASLTALRNAREAFEAAGVESSHDPKLLMEYADVLSRLDDTDLLLRTLQRVARLDPDNGIAWLGVGRSLSRMGAKHADEAAEAYRRVLAIKPGANIEAGAYDGLSDLYVADGLYDLARDSSKLALEKNPESVGAKISLAALDIREARMKSAADVMRSLGNAAPSPDSTRKLHKALSAFIESRRTFPDTPENHLAYAEILIRGDRMSDSLMPLQRAVALAPDNYVTWNMLGSIRQAVGDLSGARAAFQQSLQIKPDQPRTQQSIAEIDRAATQAPAALQPVPAAPKSGGME